MDKDWISISPAFYPQPPLTGLHASSFIFHSLVSFTLPFIASTPRVPFRIPRPHPRTTTSRFLISLLYNPSRFSRPLCRGIPWPASLKRSRYIFQRTAISESWTSRFFLHPRPQLLSFLFISGFFFELLTSNRLVLVTNVGVLGWCIILLF